MTTPSPGRAGWRPPKRRWPTRRWRRSAPRSSSPAGTARSSCPMRSGGRRAMTALSAGRSARSSWTGRRSWGPPPGRGCTAWKATAAATGGDGPPAPDHGTYRCPRAPALATTPTSGSTARWPRRGPSCAWSTAAGPSWTAGATPATSGLTLPTTGASTCPGSRSPSPGWHWPPAPKPGGDWAAFASRFFAYYEDIDWCWRARLAGMRLLYDPTATVEHRLSASSGGEHQPRVRVMAERNRTLTMVRNGPRHLVLKALSDRARNGPDGGVRSGVTRLLPWAAASRAAMSRSWHVRPEEVWSRWAGQANDWPDQAAGPRAHAPAE